MERRSWPWKKKSSDKAGEKTLPPADSAGTSLASVGSQGEQEKPKKPNYVQLSMESYAHLSGLEDEVKTLNDQVQTLNDEVDDLNEKLSVAQVEMTNKENIVKQHAKVAEEAVSGWEKADAEALALKHQLESVTLLKLTAEDKSAHLDGALKECMRQIRSLKEEHERKLHETIMAKTRQWDKIKQDFEAKISNLDEELLRSSAENSALSRALQERSNMLMKANEERSEAEAEIELLKNNVESCEREINSLKYELHIISKELDIRNEEKNMSMKSAEVANKQHLEGVKKITKLEAECQRLRGLVRKKLPGPAALAQMKLEVESLGRDYGESRPRRSPSQNPSQHLAPPPESSLESVQQCHKENDFLMGRCLAMEEEMKMLKEALAKRNNELQTSRNMCAKTMSKLRTLEAQVQVSNQQRSSPRSNIEMPGEGYSSQHGSNPPSMMSMSEDGIDEEGSCAESWATALVSELSHFKKGKNVDKSVKSENVNQIELMDDFLEMERLACSSEPEGPVSISGSVTDKKSENEDDHSVADAPKAGDSPSEQLPESDSSSKEKSLIANTELNADHSTLSKLQSRISMIFESEAKDGDVKKILEDIKLVMQDMQDTTEELHSTENDQENVAIPLTQDSKEETSVDHIIDQELATAIHQIHDFIASLGKDVMEIQDVSSSGQDIVKKSEEFSDFVNEVLANKMSLEDFIRELSRVLTKVSALSINLIGSDGNGGENNNFDCIDKVTLLEKKVVQDDSSRQRFPNGCSDNPGSLSPGFDSKFASLEELELLKSQKDNMEIGLSTCSQNLEETKLQLEGTEQLLTELKLQLASCQKSNSLAETQLKCMAESYNTLEKRTQELDAEVNHLRAEIEAINTELQEERHKTLDALAKCKDLEQQLERNVPCSTCASSIADADEKFKKEREIAAATERLAECQETIFILGKQLKALRPSDQPGFPSDFLDDGKSPNRANPQDLYESETEAKIGNESPSDVFNSGSSPYESPVNPKRPKHRATKSSSSSSTSMATPEKQQSRGGGGGGISRFFSSKAKSGQ